MNKKLTPILLLLILALGLTACGPSLSEKANAEHLERIDTIAEFNAHAEVTQVAENFSLKKQESDRYWASVEKNSAEENRRKNAEGALKATEVAAKIAVEKQLADTDAKLKLAQAQEHLANADNTTERTTTRQLSNLLYIIAVLVVISWFLTKYVFPSARRPS